VFSKNAGITDKCYRRRKGRKVQGKSVCSSRREMGIERKIIVVSCGAEVEREPCFWKARVERLLRFQGEKAEKKFTKANLNGKKGWNVNKG